eukprot:PITA_28189
MKAKIATFSLKGKVNIWWEDVKNVKGIHEDNWTWHESARLFKKKYLSERYFDDRTKEFYELWMGSMTNDDYTNIFLELLRYMPYLKEEKAKSKQKVELKHDLKRSEKAKGKWPPKRGRPQDESEKDNADPYKRFNTTKKGRGEQKSRGGSKEPLQCWICGKDHCKQDCLQYQSGGRPQIYNAQEWGKEDFAGEEESYKAKHSFRKGCVMFAVNISSDKGKEVEDANVLRRYPILQQFQDIFPEDIIQLPPHKEVDFSIELVPGATPTSKAPYMMSTSELVESKLQLKEMLENGYNRPSVSP